MVFFQNKQVPFLSVESSRSSMVKVHQRIVLKQLFGRDRMFAILWLSARSGPTFIFHSNGDEVSRLIHFSLVDHLCCLQ